MYTTALDLFNILKDFSEEELKDMRVVLEQGRKHKKILSDSEYANRIELYDSQIRLISLKERDKNK